MIARGERTTRKNQPPRNAAHDGTPRAATIYPNHSTMTTTALAILITLLLLPLLILLWATESSEQRAKRLRSYGWSQQRIADHLHVTRYRVRMALAS
jgi:hypothetical protein